MRHQVKLIVAVGAALSVAASAAPQGMDSPAGGSGARTISPVFHQLVAFTLPAPFIPAFEKTKANFYIREHVPAGETVEEWSRMVTLTGTGGLASEEGVTPQKYLQALARGFQRHCPGSYAMLDVGPAAVHEYPGYVVIASCGHLGDESGKPHSETAIMWAVKGSQDLYTFQWAERGPDSARPLSLDERYWQGQLAKLSPIRLCPIVDGEKAPYPSCLGK